MLKEWIEVGSRVINNHSLVKNSLFLPGSKTPLFLAFMRQLTNVRDFKTLESLVKKKRYRKNKACTLCKKTGARPLPKYIFPFIIDVTKFPNLYPRASLSTGFYVCKSCASKLLAAYASVIYYVDRRNKRFLGLLPYSEDSEEWKEFIYTRVLSNRTCVESGKTSNLIFLDRLRGIDFLTFQLSYPYEFVFAFLYELGKRLPKKPESKIKKFFDTFKLFIFRIDNAFVSKSIITEFSIVPIDHKLWKFVGKIIELGRKEKLLFLQRVFLYTRKYETIGKKKNPQTDLIYRNIFFKHIVFQKKIPGEIIEELLIYNLVKSESKDKPKFYSSFFAPIIFKFLKLYYDSMELSEEREILEIAENEGWKLGSKLLQVENDPKKVKTYIYELRRCRSATDFMESLNNLQLRADWKFGEKFMKLTIEKRSKFKDWKAYFLIGMANSIVVGGKKA